MFDVCRLEMVREVAAMWHVPTIAVTQRVHGIRRNQTSGTEIVVACLSNSAADTISRHSSTSPFTLPFCDRVDILFVLLRVTVGCDEWTSLVWAVRELLFGNCSKDSMQAGFKHQIVRFGSIHAAPVVSSNFGCLSG
jgi:hypothetical protein